MAGDNTAGTVEVDVTGNFSKFKNELETTGRKAGAQSGTSAGSAFASNFGSKIATLGATYLGFSLGKQIINEASDLAESVNVTGLAFGEARAAADAFGKSAADSVGLAESEARALQAQLGNVMVGFGASQTQAVRSSEELIKRAADIGSAWNASTQEVTEAIIAGFTTSTEPLRKFGVIIDQAAIEAKALELGLIATADELDNNSKRVAVTSLIWEQTNNVAGDFKNTQDGVANSTKTLNAMWGDTKAQLGTALLPMMSALLKTMRGLGPEGLKMIVIIGASLMAFIKLTQGIRALSGAFSLLSASPIVLAFLAIVAVGILVWKNWETIKQALARVWDWMRQTAGDLGRFFTELWQTVTKNVADAWHEFTGAITAAWSSVTGAVSSAASAVAGAVTGAVSAVVGAVTGAWDAVTGATSTAWNTVKSIVESIGSGLVGFITGIPGKITAAFTGLADLISAPFRLAFAGIQVAWNTTVGGFGFTMPKWIPGLAGKEFRIPSMALGGVAAEPMLAMIGDAGAANPEVVSPVQLMRDTFLDALADRPAGGGLTVNGPLIGRAEVRSDADIVRLARELAREVDRTNRASGKRVGGGTT